MAKYILPFSKPLKQDHNRNVWFFHKNPSETTKNFWVRSTHDLPKKRSAKNRLQSWSARNRLQSWSSPDPCSSLAEMNMELDLNPSDFQHFQLSDGIGFYKFCLTRFALDLDLIILFELLSNFQFCFGAVSRLLRLIICCLNCTPCLYWDHILSSDARYQPALSCIIMIIILSSKFRNLCGFHWWFRDVPVLDPWLSLTVFYI